MIDFENYERVTERNEQNKNVLKDVDMGDLYSNLSKIEQISVEYAIDRLAELEDLIEKKHLIPNCLIIKGDSGEWYVLHFNSGFFNAYQCRTRQEAEMKKEKLMESEE